MASPFDCDADPVPEHAQLLRAHPVTGKTGEILAELAWGIPFTEDQFIAKAVEVGHPRMLPALLPAALGKAVEINASTSLQDLASMMLAWFKHWSSRAQELAQQEKDLHRSLPSHRAAILTGKRILLYGELLEHYGYPDLGVVSLMRDGVDLEGQVLISVSFRRASIPQRNRSKGLPKKRLPCERACSKMRPSLRLMMRS